jgi:hypothetical protein
LWYDRRFCLVWRGGGGDNGVINFKVQTCSLKYSIIVISEVMS